MRAVWMRGRERRNESRGGGGGGGGSKGGKVKERIRRVKEKG
jgi:hypothetical protein